MSPRNLISSHYANDDVRHFSFVRRTGYRAADFRQEWRPRLRDVAYALVTVACVLGLIVMERVTAWNPPL